MDVSLAPQLAARAIKPRAPRFDFDDVPRHWFGGNVVSTHSVNGLNLLFPLGERFFVRSVHRYLDRVTDPKLREEIKGFSAQEGRHANAHERYFEALEKQGYNIRRFLRLYEKFAYGFVERILSPEMRLAATAACEHFTATFANQALSDDVLAMGHPTMRALLLWHAVEEIEHKTVAYDVLQRVNPSFALRIAGLALAGAMLGGCWLTATLMLLAQEEGGPGRVLRDLRALGARREQRQAEGRRSNLGGAIRAYMRPRFHPSKKTSDYALAMNYAATAGLA